ncbi:hypothetical protein [Amnibacterium kyonggiense]
MTTWAPTDGTATTLTWAPLSSEQPQDHSKVTYESDSAGRVSRILAPVPSGVTCGSGIDLAAGCSALFINYTGTGTSSRVSSIDYRAWDPATSAMAVTTVATYTYDANNRLVTETDARLGLSTNYTYDVYNGNLAVTSASHDGFAPYRYTYDSSTAKLLSVQRDAASSGGSPATIASYIYDLPLSTNGLSDLSATQVAKWGQTRIPSHLTAVFGMDHVPSTSAANLPADEWQNAALHYTDDDGYDTDDDVYGAGRWLTTAQFYDSVGRPTSSLDANDTFAAAAGTLTDLNAGKTITRWNADILDSSGAVLVPAHTYVFDTWSPVAPATVSGQQRSVRTHTHYDYDEGAPNSDVNAATGKPYQLVTTTTVGAASPESATEDPTVALSPDLETTAVTKTGYDPIDGASSTGTTSGWTLGKATITTVVMPNSADDIIHKTRHDSDGHVVQGVAPGSSGNDAGTTNTIYYSSGANNDDPQCGNQAQWAGAVCWSGPAAAGRLAARPSERESLRLCWRRSN